MNTPSHVFKVCKKLRGEYWSWGLSPEEPLCIKYALGEKTIPIEGTPIFAFSDELDARGFIGSPSSMKLVLFRSEYAPWSMWKWSEDDLPTIPLLETVPNIQAYWKEVSRRGSWMYPGEDAWPSLILCDWVRPVEMIYED